MQHLYAEHFLSAYMVHCAPLKNSYSVCSVMSGMAGRSIATTHIYLSLRSGVGSGVRNIACAPVLVHKKCFSFYSTNYHLTTSPLTAITD